ncbi:MAG: hypothetical protein QS98_C0005G0068 [archaeon GW2011_AR3]|nr:MAG: hypothetical protein QS98_C0005G0068 [archaeon GW2011_AR3]MBS3109427.1 VWA domain-containing protein [Candidatus Woesearchaeota archaeon]
MELIFLNPKYLWLLLSIPLLILIHLFSLRFLRARSWVFANFEAIKRVSGDQENIRNSTLISKNIWLLLVQILIITTLIMSAADPVYTFLGKSSEQSFVLAIDASSSMLANDFEPNRLEAAKGAAVIFLDALPSSTRVGLVSFSGIAFVDSQITDNLDDLKPVIDKITVKSVGGTDIGGALVTSGNILVSEDMSRSIVLLTDGRDTVGTPVIEGIDYAQSHGIVIHTIGMATESGGTFIRQDIVSTLDEDTLKYIAQTTGGSFFIASDPESLKQAFNTIVTTGQQKINMKLQLPLLLIGLAMIFLSWGLINTRYRTLP